MKVGINARRLAGQRLGVARYIEYLVDNWTRMATPRDRFTLYVWEPLSGEALHSEAFEARVLTPRLTGILWENLVLPRHAHDRDVLFCPSYTVPLTYRGRSVVAIHSVNEAQEDTHSWWYHWTYRQLYRLSAQKADMVLVPSESTKQDVEAHYRIPGRKIRVVPLGVDDAFRPIDDPDLLRSTRQRYFADARPYILFVGKLSQRRNIPALLGAFRILKKRFGMPHNLLLVGPNHLNLPLESMAAGLGISDSFIQTDGKFASHRDLVLVYNAADLYVNPSLYEGFSLPLVEAMACGLPVVATNRAALREIADGSALLVDDPNVDALAEAMHRALSDPGLNQDLRVKALQRARAFRWENTARETLEILRHVANR